MPKILGLTIVGLSPISFGAILKMKLDATITLDILVQRKVGEIRFLHVLAHQILLIFCMTNAVLSYFL